jgi:hypothetical protein
MAKWCLDAAMDAMLANIATCTALYVCSAQPANHAGIAAVALADVTLTAGDGNGDYTIGDGDTNGRKVRVAQQADVDIDTSGNATHIALDDGTTLRYVTTCTTQALVDTGTVTVPAWDVEVADPA